MKKRNTQPLKEIPAQGGNSADTGPQKYATFTVGSIVIMVVGFDKILAELKAAENNPQASTDLIWLLGKLLKEKSSRELLNNCYGLSMIVQELFEKITLRPENLEQCFAALKALYSLSSYEKIHSVVNEINGIEKLMVCLRARNTIDDIPRISAKVLQNLFSEECGFEERHVGTLIGLLEREDLLLKKDVAKMLCNICNTEKGKSLLFKCNVVPHLNKILQNEEDPALTQYAVATFANMATCQELKRPICESGSLILLVHTLQQAVNSSNVELIKFSLYFIGNVCEEFFEAAYVLGKFSIFYQISLLLSKPELKKVLLLDIIDTTSVLIKIKDNFELIVQENIPELIVAQLDGGENAEEISHILELIQQLVFDIKICQRLLNGELIIRLAKLLNFANPSSNDIVKDSLRCLASIGHKIKLAPYLDSQTTSQLQKIKAQKTLKAQSQLAEYILGLANTGPRPERGIEWQTFNLELAEQLTLKNSFSLLSQNISNSPLVNKVDEVAVAPPKTPPRNNSRTTYHRANVTFTPEIGLLLKEEMTNNNPPGYPLKPQYYKAEYGPLKPIQSKIVNPPEQSPITLDLSYGMQEHTITPLKSNITRRQISRITSGNKIPKRDTASATPIKMRFGAEAPYGANQKISSLLPSRSKVQMSEGNTSDICGIVKQISEQYMDTDLTDKVDPDSKITRNLLGIGMIEAIGLKKATKCLNIRDLVKWYSSQKDAIKARSTILYGVASAVRADKIIDIVKSLSRSN